jgi:peptidoglycan-N-acetylglucosamine deacetylase
MWSAGVGWRDDRYQVVVLDGRGRPAVPRTAFEAHRLDGLLALLCSCRDRSGGTLAAVLDTTAGVLERPLLEAGLVVRRADPWLVPPRPPAGSTDPAALARIGLRTPTPLATLTIVEGGLHGRDDEVHRAAQAAAAVEQRLAGDGRLLRRGPADDRTVALTFDDGPNPGYTEAVLDVLGRHRAVATFFCVGLPARAYPSTVARIAAEGHLVANHTWSHAYLPDLAEAEVREQVDRTNEALAAATGQAPTLVRPPYGGRSARVLRWLADSGMTTVLWDVESWDWALISPEAIERDILAGAGGGSVVLLHDGGGDRSRTVAALPRILTRLAERGYRFVPVTEFLPARRER